MTLILGPVLDSSPWTLVRLVSTMLTPPWLLLPFRTLLSLAGEKAILEDAVVCLRKQLQTQAARWAQFREA